MARILRQAPEDSRENSERVGRNRTIRLMQEQGLCARARKRFTCTTVSNHDQPVGERARPELRCRAPDQRRVGDTTEMLTSGDGEFFLSAIVICSRGSASAGP
jgi:putative transposase